MALKKVYSEFDYDDNCSDRRIAYPRPISEPSTPQSSRTASPNRSESDSVDSDAEVSSGMEINIHQYHQHSFFYYVSR